MTAKILKVLNEIMDTNRLRGTQRQSGSIPGLLCLLTADILININRIFVLKGRPEEDQGRKEQVG